MQARTHSVAGTMPGAPALTMPCICAPHVARACEEIVLQLSTHYLQVAQAASLWDGTGGLLFTSSVGLYTVDDGSHCNEDSPTAQLGASERTDK